MRRFLFVSLLAVLLLGMSSASYGQGGVGEIAGTVYDASGGTVDGAKVTLANPSTGFSHETLTAGGGSYRFGALPVVGTYTITVDQPGFRRAEISGIIISVGATTAVDVHLEVGGQSETVRVEAGAELVTPTESQISQLIDHTVWENMPLEIRNQNTFINLVAGVVPNDFGGTTRGAAVNGARPGMGNFLVEGYDNNDQGQGGRGSEGSGAITSISPEAIQEYRVITHTFAAEYGKGGAFVTDTVLKSGTNELHGSLFEYNRVQALAANDFFSNAAGQKDSLVRNQFGGSLGGRIISDRWVFYGFFYAHRRRQGAPLPTVQGVTQECINCVKSGAFATFMESDPNGFCLQNRKKSDPKPAQGPPQACPGAFSQSATLGSIFTKLLGSQPFPLAQRNFSTAAQGNYTTGLTYPVPVYGDVTLADNVSFNQHRVSFKSDYKFSEKDSLSGTFLYTNEETVDKYGGGDTTIGPAFVNPARSVLLGLTYTRNFTPSVLNQLRADYLRRRSDYPNAPGAENVPSIVTYTDPLGVGFGNGSSLPQFFTDNQFQYRDDLSIIHGRHAFKFGGEYRRTRNGSSFQANKNGLFQPYGVEELLTDGFFGDVADQLLNGPGKFVDGSFGFAQASINPVTGGFPEYYRGYRANEFAFYGQDDWKVSSRLTLNLGLRWEYFGPPHNFRSGIDSNVYFGAATLPIPVNSSNPFFPVNNTVSAMEFGAQAIQKDHEIWQKDKNNWGPRVGFAWDVFGNQKVVFRGGGGFYYDRIWNNLFENIRFNPPFFAFSTLGSQGAGAPPVGPLATPGLYGVPFTNPQPFLAFAGKPAPRHMDQNLETPYIQQASLGLQWAFARDFMLEVDGTYTGGRKLTGVMDINTYDGRVACPSGNTRGPCKAAAAAGLIPASGSFSTRRVNTAFAGDNFRTNAFTSTYTGLQVTLAKSFSNGLLFNSNYTWSHAIDTLSDAFNGSRGNILRPTDNFNIAVDRGSADFDIRHRFVFGGTYDWPFFSTNHWIGGWRISGNTILQTGVPIPIYNGTSSRDTNRDGYNTDRPVITGDPYLRGMSPADGWLNTSAFTSYTCPSTVNLGLWCDSPQGRNTVRGPGFVNTDFGLAKRFQFTERWRLTFQANFFNIFNHPNFAPPVGNRYGNSSQFGKSTSDFNGPRVTQLALRLDF